MSLEVFKGKKGNWLQEIKVKGDLLEFYREKENLKEFIESYKGK